MEHGRKQWNNNSSVQTDGKPLGIQPQVEQSWKKIHITLSQQRCKPGIYTVKTTSSKMKNTHPSQLMGLVSLTQEKYYKPGETAYLLSFFRYGGHPVCDSNTLEVQNQTHRQLILFRNGIMPNAKCGLYDANFTTNQNINMA